ncbi:hypothetical protein NE237_032032 [Protea cynaroides]|uniref:Uncharacterized protein n=1 Tax=Protea cynaroides TaxID=273540 RepID=A0A9Q0R357_9MAGN|nr:hypothetical protein NE237_032032 [Protea cynaroides]
MIYTSSLNRNRFIRVTPGFQRSQPNASLLHSSVNFSFHSQNPKVSSSSKNSKKSIKPGTHILKSIIVTPDQIPQKNRNSKRKIKITVTSCGSSTDEDPVWVWVLGPRFQVLSMVGPYGSYSLTCILQYCSLCRTPLAYPWWPNHCMGLFLMLYTSVVLIEYLISPLEVRCFSFIFLSYSFFFCYPSLFSFPFISSLKLSHCSYPQSIRNTGKRPP